MSDVSDDPEFGEEDENDPELRELRTKICAARMVCHKRENTADIRTRLGQQIFEAATAKIDEEAKAGAVQGEFELDSLPGEDSEDPSATAQLLESILQNCEPSARSTLDKRWERCMAEEADNDSPESLGLIAGKGMRKVESAPVPARVHEQTMNYEVPKTFLYDLLLEKYRFHRAAVNEHHICRLLADTELSLKSTKDSVAQLILLAQLYFNLAMYSQAESAIGEAVRRSPKSAEARYWEGLTALYSCHCEGFTEAKAMLAENSLLTYLQARRSANSKTRTDVMALWALLVLSLELKHAHPELRLAPKNPPEVYSMEIRKIDDYLGYVSWSEIYAYSRAKERVEDAKDILWELIQKDGYRPEAYVKLWALYRRQNSLGRCLDLSEKLFLDGCEFEEQEYSSVIVMLCVKSAVISKYFLVAYQKLQYQYLLYPTQPYFLYYYAKAVCLTPDEPLRSSAIVTAIGALQECLISCHRSYHGKVHYWLGRLRGMQGEAMSSLRHYCLAMESGVKYAQCENILKSMAGVHSNLVPIWTSIIQSKEGKKVALDKAHKAFTILKDEKSEYLSHLRVLWTFHAGHDPEEAERLLIDYLTNYPAPRLEYIAELYPIAVHNKKYSVIELYADRVDQLISKYNWPTQELIQAHIALAKAKLKLSLSNVSEAIALLQSLASLFPSLPFPSRHQYEVPGGVEQPLQRRSQYFRSTVELSRDNNAMLKSFVPVIPEMGSEERENARNFRADEGANLVEFPEMQKMQTRLDYIKRIKYRRQATPYQEHRIVRDEITKSGATATVLSSTMGIRQSTRETERSVLSECGLYETTLAVSTDWTYLYYLGKLLVNREGNYRLGVFVLCDCMEIMRMHCMENDLMYHKSKLLICEALIRCGQIVQATPLLAELQKHPAFSSKARDLLAPSSS